MRDACGWRVLRKRRLRRAQLAQQRDRIDAAELEIHDKAATPAAREPRLDEVAQHMVRLLDEIAEEPVKNLAIARGKSECVLAAVLNVRVVEGAAHTLS